MIDEDWNTLVSFFPTTWRELAFKTNALKGLRKDKCEEALLRTLMLHFGCGYSLRETAVKADQANIACLSDVALLKRIRKSKDWLHQLCLWLFKDRDTSSALGSAGRTYRLFDATIVKEPGKTGSLWRIHYSFQVPSLICDHFSITAVEGTGTGESLKQFPISKGDFIIADRGYCTASGMHYVSSSDALFTVRVNSTALNIFDKDGKKMNLLSKVTKIKQSGEVSAWYAYVKEESSPKLLPIRICAIRKSKEAIKIAHEKIRKLASKKQSITKPETFTFAEYVIVATTFPETEFSAQQILENYRIRWQIELLFKRFKQIAQLGHLPKYDEESSKAWLYGKLFIALITEKIVAHAAAISPWGYDLESITYQKSLA